MVLKQRPPLLVTVSAAVLLVLGGAAAYFGIRQRLSGTTKLPLGMDLVPSDALVTLTLTTDSNRWMRLRQLGTPGSQKSLERQLVNWRDRIIRANGYRFRADIQPWLGDQVTLAFLPKADGGEAAAEFVLVVPIADSSKAQDLLAEPQQGVNWVGRDYQGVAIQSIKTTEGEAYEGAVLGNEWLVLTSGAKAMEAVIDSANGGASMATNDAYRRALKHLQMPSALAQLYVNVPAAGEMLLGSEALPGINGLVAAVQLLPYGLDIDAATWLGPEDQPVYEDMENARLMMPQRLPESTVLMLSTGNIGPLWQTLGDADQLNTLLPISVDALTQGLRTQTGLDMENDILPWLSGEVAFGLLPPAATRESSIPMGQLALIAEVADRQAAEATWEQLDEVMTSRFRFNVESLQVNAQPVNQLVSYYGGIAMGYGWLNETVTFFGMGPDVLDAITPAPRKTLKAHRTFQTLLKSSPPESSGYFFADLERLEDLQGTLPFPTVPNGPVFSAIKSVGVSTRVIDERSLRHDILIELPKGRRVRPLPD